MLSDMSSSAAIRMKVSIPASYLHNTEKLNSLPLPVTIEKATRYIEGSGANIGDEIVVFDWFSMEDAQDRETANLIGDFVGAIVRAFNGKTASPATTSTPADRNNSRRMVRTEKRKGSEEQYD